jgi:predicted Zn-dependent peptidase
MGNFRKGGPPINILRKVNLPRYEKNILDNGLPLYSVSMGTQDIIKLEVVFFSGRPYEAKKVVSRACNSQIKEGSLDLNSKQISEEIDFYGATLRTSEDLDSCSISLFCLNKYFDKLLPIFHEIVTTPQFPADELRKFIKNNVERLKVDLTKNDVIAYRTLTEKVFSKEHPYGYNSEIDDYRALVKEDLVSHYKNNYGYNNSNIFISGKVNDTHITLCNKYFGRQFQICTPNESIPLIQKSIPENLHIKSGKEFQTAIKMGRRLFDRQHEDYAGLYILNAVFGGYFGSRLMSNIREDKGYTYNIYSEVDVMKHDGIFIIGTEVSDEYVNKTKKE